MIDIDIISLETSH